MLIELCHHFGLPLSLGQDIEWHFGKNDIPIILAALIDRSRTHGYNVNLKALLNYAAVSYHDYCRARTRWQKWFATPHSLTSKELLTSMLRRLKRVHFFLGWEDLMWSFCVYTITRIVDFENCSEISPSILFVKTCAPVWATYTAKYHRSMILRHLSQVLSLPLSVISHYFTPLESLEDVQCP